jgi:hypothetical protein
MMVTVYYDASGAIAALESHSDSKDDGPSAQARPLGNFEHVEIEIEDDENSTSLIDLHTRYKVDVETRRLRAHGE